MCRLTVNKTVDAFIVKDKKHKKNSVATCLIHMFFDNRSHHKIEKSYFDAATIPEPYIHSQDMRTSVLFVTPF